MENIIIRSHYVYCDFNMAVRGNNRRETENYCNDWKGPRPNLQ